MLIVRSGVEALLQFHFYVVLRATHQARVRETEALFGQLEAERSSLTRRAIGAEEQLSELQSAMAAKLVQYQKEILKLRSANQS